MSIDGEPALPQYRGPTALPVRCTWSQPCSRKRPTGRRACTRAFSDSLAYLLLSRGGTSRVGPSRRERVREPEIQKESLHH